METVRLRAKGTFNSQYGMVRRGEIFWSEPGYANDMIRNGNASREPDEAPLLEPQRTAVIPKAPLPGKEPATENLPDPSPQRISGEALDNGQDKPVSASPRGRRSRRKT